MGLRLAWVLSLGVLFGCGDDGGDGTDAGSDAADAGDLVFAADPDPAELDTCTTSTPAAGEVRAKHVSCESELLAGTVAMGRVGRDVLIENAVARFVIRGGDGSASLVGVGAGGIVDAAVQGGTDLVKDVLPLSGVSAARATEVVVTQAGGDVARVRVLFEMEVVGLIAAVVPVLEPERVRGAIDYELRADEPLLRVTVRVTTVAGVASDSFSGGFAALVGGEGDLVHPFGTGARLVLEGPESATSLRLVGEGSLTEVASITIFEGQGLRALRGEETAYELLVGVGATAAEAFAATEAGQTGLADLELRGTAGERVEIATPDGTVVLRTRIGAAGSSRVPLPSGPYVIRSGFGPWLSGEDVAVTLSAAGATADVAAVPSGTLTVDVLSCVATDCPTMTPGAPLPVRVTIATPAGEELDRLVAIGRTDFRLPVGEYRVTVSRGLEHDFVQSDVTVRDGLSATIEGETLARVIDTTGWVAGDFHLHAEMSTDSRHWLPDALRIVAAEGLDVVASTDHDFVTDYDRYAAEAGVDGLVLFVPGAEVSHPLIAHVNGYPLVSDPMQSANGAPAWFMSSPTEWFARIRAIGDTSLDPEGALVQINHPRRSTSGLFESIELDRATGTAGASPIDLGLDAATDLNDFAFDSIEVWNKTPDGDDEESLLDYLALYTLGRRFTMMGNSDTHDDGRQAGTIRTYVAVPDDSRGGFAWTDVATGIRARAATVSAGIFVTAAITSVDAAADTAAVHVSVQAPPYVTVERLRVYAGTDVPIDMPLAAPGELDLTVPLAGARFVAVRVDGGRGDPVVTHETLGMTNPIDVP